MSDQWSLEQSKPMFATLSEAWKRRCLESPKHTFLIENNQSISYAQLDQDCLRFIDFFRRKKISKSDLVAIQLPTSIVAVKLIVACFKLQIAIMPISIHLDGEELQNIIKTMSPKMVILSNNNLAVSSANELITYNSVMFDAHEVEPISCLLRRVDAKPAKLPIDVAAILLTSGTTGVPKGVMLSEQNILYSETSFTSVFNIMASDVLLLALPLNHAIGFHHGIVSTILTGGTCVLLKEYKPQKCLELIKKHHCTYALAVPTIVYDFFKNTRQKHFLEKIICGGSPISDQLLNEAMQREIPVYNVFGTTECVPFVCTTPTYYKKKLCKTTAGFPITGVSMKIIDTAGHEITQSDKSGEIVAKGPVVFKGYFQNEAATAQVLDKNNWFHTGDLGHYNMDAALKVDGRMNDIIMRGGEKVSARTVEKEVLAYPEIQQAAAIGVRDGRLGERIGVCITLTNPDTAISLSDLKRFLKSRQVLKKYWPEKLFVCETFPMTDSGKVKKHLLKQRVGI